MDRGVTFFLLKCSKVTCVHLLLLVVCHQPWATKGKAPAGIQGGCDVHGASTLCPMLHSMLSISLHLNISSDYILLDVFLLHISCCSSHLGFLFYSLMPSSSFILLVISQPNNLGAPACLFISVTDLNYHEDEI